MNDETRRKNLEAANAIRTSRARTIERVHALPLAESRAAAAELIEDTPPELESMGIEYFLIRAVRRIGPIIAGRLLTSMAIEPTVAMRWLTVRDRRVLASALRSPTLRVWGLAVWENGADA